MGRPEHQAWMVVVYIGHDLWKMVVLEGDALLTAVSVVSECARAADHEMLLSRAPDMVVENRVEAREKDYVERWDKGLRS